MFPAPADQRDLDPAALDLATWVAMACTRSGSVP
jgi:hypothetical protein